MIKVWYRHHQRPRKGNIIQADAINASTLPPSFDIVGVEYGRRLSSDKFDSNQSALRVNPPSDNISTDAVDSITAFESNWGGSIEHVETVQV